MKIKLTKPYGFAKKGDVVDYDSGIARTLIQYGKAEAIPEPKPERQPQQAQQAKPWSKKR